MVSDPDLLPHIRITRLKHRTTALEMARFCLAHVLQDVQNLDAHRKFQSQAKWLPLAPKRVADLKVGVLGLGHIGAETARLFVNAGFDVIGWSRSEKQIDGVECVFGRLAFEAILGQCDYLLSILPSTPETTNLFDREAFRRINANGFLVNVGRGTLIVQAELIQALDQGRLRHAVLDVFQEEPLPANNPLWKHAGVTITPHVSGWDLDDGICVVAENYRRLMNGSALLHEIDRQLGY